MMSQELGTTLPADESATCNLNNENENPTVISPKKEPVDFNTSEEGTLGYHNDNASGAENIDSKRSRSAERKKQKRMATGKSNDTDNHAKEKEEKQLRFKENNSDLNNQSDTNTENNINFSDDNSSEEDASGDSSYFNSQDSSGNDSEEEEMKNSFSKKKRSPVVSQKRKDPDSRVKGNKVKRLKKSEDLEYRKSSSTKVTRKNVVHRKKSKPACTSKIGEDSDSEMERLRERRRISQYQRRQNPEVRARERAFQNLRRKDPAVRERERQRQALRRKDPAYRKRENLTIAARRRNNEELRELENAKMALRRRDPDYARREREMHKKNLQRRKQGAISLSENSEVSQSVSSKNEGDKLP